MLGFIIVLANPWVALDAAQTLDVTGTVALVSQKPGETGVKDQSNAVVWLRPVDETVPPPTPGKYEMRQKHKRFEPSVIAIPAGSVVAFPNLDPFFHNVFSLYDGKKFDLGLYEAGASRSVTFEHPGICYVFCNIHPEMAAAIIVVDTPYYAVTGRNGEYRIGSVSPGRYLLSVWHQRGKPAGADVFPRQIRIDAEHTDLAPIRLIDSGALLVPHTNKYGRSYDSGTSSGDLYK
jgi:plastocyanin